MNAERISAAAAAKSSLGSLLDEDLNRICFTSGQGCNSRLRASVPYQQVTFVEKKRKEEEAARVHECCLFEIAAFLLIVLCI